VLVGVRGAYRLAQPLATIQVPATVQAVLAARIDRLPPEAKRLLQTAAVIGTEVPLLLLQAIAESPEAALHNGLTHLQAAEFVYETRLFPEVLYTFKHALTHEVAYGSLLQERRRVLHARIVDALKRLHADRLTEQVERLAHHALRGEVWDKAVIYCRQAGAKAVARSANQEAVAYFEQALDALPHLPDSRATREQAIDLRFNLRIALLPLGAYGCIVELLRDATAVAEALGDQRRLGRISAFMAEYYFRIGESDRAVEFSQRALARAEVGGDVVVQVEAMYRLGVAYESLGDYRQAIDFLERAVASSEGDLVGRVPEACG
jgi:predicted ATPase